MSNYRRVFIQNSYVFLTVITNNRSHILIKNIELLREAFRNVGRIYKYKIIACVILPEHLHIILYPENIKEYPKIISSIKHYFSANLDIKMVELSASKIKKREKGIWLRRYIEHTIVSEDDLNKHINYIHYNPVKHGYAKNVKDWEYSSFHKFVKLKNYDENWGSGSSDIENIKKLDYE